MKKINIIFLCIFIAMLIGCEPKKKLEVKITDNSKSVKILNKNIAIIDSVEVFRNEVIVIKPKDYSKEEVLGAFNNAFSTAGITKSLKLSEGKQCKDCDDAIFVIEGNGLENYSFQLSPGNGAACQSNGSSCISDLDLSKNLAFLQIKPPVKPQVSAKQINKDEIIVAILDSGIDSTDTFIQANASKILPGINVLDGSADISDETAPNGPDSSPQRHGTKIAKIILDQTKEANIKILPIKILKTCPGNLFDAICGIYTAKNHKAKILNLSWNFKATKEIRNLTAKVFNMLEQNQIYVSTAAGNDMKNLDDWSLYSVCFSDSLKYLYGVTSVFTDKKSGEITLFGNMSDKYVEIGVNSQIAGYFKIPNDNDSKGTSYATAFFTAYLCNYYPYTSPATKGPIDNIPNTIITP